MSTTYKWYLTTGTADGLLPPWSSHWLNGGGSSTCGAVPSSDTTTNRRAATFNFSNSSSSTPELIRGFARYTLTNVPAELPAGAIFTGAFVGRADALAVDKPNAHFIVLVRHVGADGSDKGTLLTTTSSKMRSQHGQTVRILSGTLAPAVMAPGDRLLVEVGGYLDYPGAGGSSFIMANTSPLLDSVTAPDLPSVDGAAAPTNSGNAWITIDVPDPPNPPTGLTQTDATLDSVEVSWTPPASGEPPTSYEYRVDGGAPVDVGLATSTVIGGLSQATTYNIEVRSVAASGESAWVSVSATTTTSSVTTYKWYPVNVATTGNLPAWSSMWDRVGSIVNERATVPASDTSTPRWNIQSRSGANDVVPAQAATTRYMLRYTLDDLPLGALAGATFQSVMAHSINPQIVGDVRLLVRHSNAAGADLGTLLDTSSGSMVSTDGLHIRVMSGVLAAATISAGDRLIVEIGAHIHAPSRESRYLYVENTSPSGSASITAPDLPATTGTVVTAGSGNAWITLDVPTPPNPPTGLTQTGASSDTVTVAWTPPAIGPAPEGYEVRLSSGAWVDVGLVTSHTFTGLYPETGYPVEVRAYAGGLYSTSVSITATTTEYVPPPESPSCFTPIRGSVLRVTELDHCGSYASQNVRFATTSGIIKVTVEEETTSQSAEIFRTPEGELRMVLRKGTQPIRNTVDIEFIKVEPHVLELVAGVIPVVHPGDNVVGFDNLVRRKPVSFALEVWSKLTTKDCDEQQQWGHTLFPHLRGGRLKGFAFTNGLVSFTLVGAQTRRSGNWGVGPHEVQDWVEPVSRNTNFRLTTTPVPPPEANCEMQLALPAP